MTESTSPPSERVSGIDGCRSGWLVVTVPLAGKGGYDIKSVSDLTAVVDDLDAGRLRAAAIDMPMGLPDSGPRSADIEVRRRLGPRRFSVFPSPMRSVLGAPTYEEACARSRDASGKAISKQLFNILHRIDELDRVVTPLRQDRLVEMCPEWSLTVLAGSPMAWPKRTPEGRHQRIAALGAVFGHKRIADSAARPPRGAAADDVLDAFAGAWTARRLATGTAIRVGGELDARGLRMEVVA